MIFRFAVAAAALAAVAGRLWLSRRVTGAYTDEIMVATLIQEPGRFAGQAPLASLLVEAVHGGWADRLQASRDLSALAAGASVVVAAWIAGRLAGRVASIGAAMLLAAAPLSLFWGCRADQAPLHTLLLLVVAAAAIRACNGAAAWTAHVAVAAFVAASAARYEGIVWLPVALWTVWRVRQRLAVAWLLAYVPLAVWALSQGRFAYADGWNAAYGARAPSDTAAWILRFALAYVRDLPALLTPVALAAAVCGAAILVRRREAIESRVALACGALAFAEHFAHIAYPFYRSAYLLPGAAACAVAGGVALGALAASPARRAIAVSALCIGAGCSAWEGWRGTQLVLAHADVFGEVLRTARCLDAMPPATRVVSDEVPRTRFVLRRDILSLADTPAAAGDVLVLHEYYAGPLASQERELARRFRVEILCRAASRYQLVGPDVLPTRNQQPPIAWVEYRGQTISFAAVVLRLSFPDRSDRAAVSR